MPTRETEKFASAPVTSLHHTSKFSHSFHGHHSAPIYISHTFQSDIGRTGPHHQRPHAASSSVHSRSIFLTVTAKRENKSERQGGGDQVRLTDIARPSRERTSSSIITAPGPLSRTGPDNGLGE